MMIGQWPFAHPFFNQDINWHHLESRNRDTSGMCPPIEGRPPSPDNAHDLSTIANKGHGKPKTVHKETSNTWCKNEPTKW